MFPLWGFKVNEGLKIEVILVQRAMAAEGRGRGYLTTQFTDKNKAKGDRTVIEY